MPDSHPLIPQEGKPAPSTPVTTHPPTGCDAGRSANDADKGATELIQAERVDYRAAQAQAGWAAPAAETGAELLAASFSGVVDRYQAPLVSFLYGMVGNREQAEDLSQDTLIKAYEAMERRHDGQQFTAGWLFRIARNTAIDAMRRKRLISWLPFGVEHEQLLPTRGDFAGQLAERELVRQALSQMPPRYRECLLLRTVVGMSNIDIAQALGLSARNTNTLLFRARERFREIYIRLDPQGADSTIAGDNPVHALKGEKS
jgi:RNA polymerase sigma-70 factor (ECF subfamily)